MDKLQSHYPDKLKYLIELYELNFGAGNVLKYIVRCYLKGKEKDIDKAIDYVESDWTLKALSFPKNGLCDGSGISHDIFNIKDLTDEQNEAIIALTEYLFENKPQYFYKDKLLKALYNLKKEILDESK